MQLLIGTNNPGKIIEIADVLKGLRIEIKRPKDLGITKSPHETGETFGENALQKARFYYEQSTLPTVADDSGIIVDALKNELGIHTRRWGAGPDASDQEWIEYFLERMAKEKNKRARFVCALAYIDSDSKEHVFEGTCEGTITSSLEADYLPGLPISACFRPDGFKQVYSAMTTEQKNSTSHRGRATKKFRTFLEIALK
jgi:XTP/dITP diphosphohydrolase